MAEDIHAVTTHAASDNTLIVTLGKMLDNNNASEVAGLLSRAQEDGYRYIILDMAHLDFISSAGVGAILGTVDMFREAGGDIILCNASSTVLHVLKVLDLADYLTVKSDQQEAMALCSCAELGR